MSKRLIALFALGILSAASCAELSAYKYRQWYAMVGPVENSYRHYEDDKIAFQFEISEKRMDVAITNKGMDNISLKWPKVRYVDPSGKSHVIANNQTLFTKDPSRIKPADLPPGKTERNVIVPLSNIEKLEKWTWSIKPLFNQKDEKALLNKDKTFGIIFPVTVGEERIIYRFDFAVTNVLPYRGQNPR